MEKNQDTPWKVKRLERIRVVENANERKRTGIYHRCADGEHIMATRGSCSAMDDSNGWKRTRRGERGN